MRIEHLAIWVQDLDKMVEFYQKYFPLKAGEKYVNELKQFSSYFLSFESGTRLELMHKPDIQKKSTGENSIGLAHFAFSVGSRDKVDELTEVLRKAGMNIPGEPRVTGDGYYESVIEDPEGNCIELTE